MVDEIYHGLTYGTDAASVLEVDDEAFVLNSFSKYFGMTGWRLGWLVAPPAAVPELEKLAQNLYISAPSMAQHAALACFEPATLEILEARRGEFARRRDFLLPALRELGFGIAVEPQEPSICMQTSAPSVATPMGSASTCWKRSTSPSRRDWISAVTGAGHHVRFAYTQDLPRRNRPSSASPAACVAGGPDALRATAERGRLVRRYKRFLADIVTDEGEAMCIHCPNTGSMLNCMSEGARCGSSAAAILDASCPAPGSWWRRRRGDWPA